LITVKRNEEALQMLLRENQGKLLRDSSSSSSSSAFVEYY
jgi:hypothetical protein